MEMWKSLTTGFRSVTGAAPAPTAGEEEGKHEEVDDEAYDPDEEGSRIEYAEAQLLPCEAEKKHILSMFYTMRKDSFFCDVAFVCNGVLFRAHRVVVSSWSRWLRALLCESPDEEVISLDFFDATAFGSALDYMYGVPLTITVENADSTLKVVRRLEMQKLEQQCWRYLMTVINPDTNAEILHELADRYDCPPLKLAAWRILQQKMPNNGASLATSRLLKKGKEGMQAKLGITGLTGPGEIWFHNSVGLGGGGNQQEEGRLNVRAGGNEVDIDLDGAEEEEELQRAKRMMPSVFSELREAEQAEEDEEQDALDEYYGSEDGSYRDRKNKFGWDQTNYKDPAELDATASAAEIVQAWAFRLKEVYDQCTPSNALDYEDPDSFMIPANSPNVRLTTMTYPRHGHGAKRTAPVDKRSALLGEPEPETPTPPPRRQSDQYFKLVPSSSSVGGGSHSVPPPPPPGAAPAATGPEVSPLARSASRRPPPPTAANTTSAVESPQSVKLSRWPAVGAPKTIDWREEMRRFYIAIGMPEKIAGISTILATWAGREEEMLTSLMEKYRTLIPTQLSNHLEQLISHLETHTESSFVRGPPVSATPASPGLPKSPQRKPSTRARPSPLRTNL